LNCRFFIFYLLFFPAFFLFGQTHADSSIMENADTVYVIREVEFVIEGRTRPYVLMSNGEFKEGERIRGKENLEKYLAQKQQLLFNQQVLEEVKLEYSLGDSEEDDALPVKLLVHVKDTWNIIILPYPQYDSNEGFSITLKARDYNFLGTMNPLRVDLGYRQKDGEHSFDFSLESDIPFHAAGLDWNLRSDNLFSYTFEEPLYYQNVTGISLKLPWLITTFTIGINQYLTINEENIDENREIYGLDSRFYGPFGSTELFASWKIPLGIDTGDFGELTYIPLLSGRINYPYGRMDDPRMPVTNLSHSIGFGRVNWIGNFRKGFSVSIGNSYSWYFDRIDAPLKVGLDGGAVIHWPLSKYFGVSSRLKYRQWWHWSDIADGYIPHYSSGDLIRGVLYKDIRAYQILTFNLDFPVRVLRFWPSEWFNNQNLRLFNFEMHFSPFTDMALFHGPYSKLKNRDNPMEGNTSFRFDDMINTAGLEVLVFPSFFRSMKIRASIGYNINKIKKDGISDRLGFLPYWDEIFIGLDHFY
jgi:hypothetical protein